MGGGSGAQAESHGAKSEQPGKERRRYSKQKEQRGQRCGRKRLAGAERTRRGLAEREAEEEAGAGRSLSLRSTAEGGSRPAALRTAGQAGFPESS